jgi:predicted TPR repeat methyltransferase
MKRLHASSGDLVADRRASYAEMLAGDGDWSAAADLMHDTLSLAPAWGAGWYRLGELLSEAGRAAEAIDAWREALRLDPADRLGAALKLELAGAVVGPGLVPSGFAETLFDQYAATFDKSLVEKLAYRVPELLAGAIAATGRGAFAHALDLGCGTGLMGERLRHATSFLEGVDISAGMLAQARAKGIYDGLDRQDLQLMEPRQAKVDLVAAADVLLYLGRLEELVAAVSSMLAPGGLFAFSVERHDGPDDLVLRDSRRYAHSAAYLRRVLEASGLEVLSMTGAPIREDRGAPVEGLIVVAARNLGDLASAPAAVVMTEDEQPVLQ